ncbi:MAG: hypothetical protein AAF211_15335, partial [Myxococcota bacterium]
MTQPRGAVPWIRWAAWNVGAFGATFYIGYGALIWTLQHGALSELAPGLWLGENDAWRWRSASGWIWSL